MSGTRAAWILFGSLALATACGGKTSTEGGTADGGGTGDGSSGGSESSTGADSGTSATSAATDDSGGSAGFVQVDMLGDAMCDIWNPDDCPEGEKCMPYASDPNGTWDALKCSPVTDPGKLLGDECYAEEGSQGGVDDCGAGLFCYYVNADTNIGTCIEFCTGSPSAPMCGPNAICTIVNDGVLVLCRPECDPISQDCQPPGSGCYQATGTGSFTCIADKSGPNGAYGDECAYISSCDPGLACLDATAVPGCLSGSCCSPFCDLNAPANCPDPAQVCEPYYEMPDPGYEHVGVCAVPQPDHKPGTRAVGHHGPERESGTTPTPSRR